MRLGTNRPRNWAAAAALGLSAAPATAQRPVVVPPGQAAPAASGVEIFYGTRNATPRPATSGSVYVITATAPAPAPEAPRPRVEAPVYVPVVAAPQPSGVTRASAEAPAAPASPITSFFGAVMDRAVPGARHGGVAMPQVVIIREPAPAPVAVAAPAPAAQPQIVVVREGGSAPAVAPADLTPVLALVGGAGGMTMLGLAGAAVYALRRPQTPPAAPAATVAAGPPPLATEIAGPKLMGMYSVGPLPESAERFEMGPSIEDEQAAAKRREEEQAAAVIADVLAQNLEMFAAFGAAEEEAAPEAVPAQE